MKKINKGIVKKRTKIVAKTLTSIVLVGTIATVGICSFFKIKNSKNSPENKPTYESRYQQNVNITPGYYNENPIRVGISNKFKQENLEIIVSSIKNVDEVSLGLTFMITNIEKEDFQDIDILIQPRNLPNNILGQGSQNKPDAKKIIGQMNIDENKFDFYNLKSTVMHEMFHILGLTHSKDQNSLMHPNSHNYSITKDIKKDINTIYPAKTKESLEYYYKHNTSAKIYEDELLP